MAIDYNQAWSDIESSQEYQSLPRAKQRQYRAQFGKYVGDKLGMDARTDFIKTHVTKEKAQPLKTKNALDIAGEELKSSFKQSTLGTATQAVRGKPQEHRNLIGESVDAAGDLLRNPGQYLNPLAGETYVGALGSGAAMLGQVPDIALGGAVGKAIAKPLLKAGLSAGKATAAASVSTGAGFGGTTAAAGGGTPQDILQSTIYGAAFGALPLAKNIPAGKLNPKIPSLTDAFLAQAAQKAGPVKVPQRPQLPAARQPLMLPEKTGGPVLPSDGTVIPLNRIPQRQATPNLNQAVTPEVIPGRPVPAPQHPAYTLDDILEMQNLLYRQGADRSDYVAPPAAPTAPPATPRYVAPQAPEAYHLDDILEMQDLLYRHGAERSPYEAPPAQPVQPPAPPRYATPKAPHGYTLEELLEMQQQLYRQGQQDPKASAPVRNDGGSPLSRLVREEEGSFKPGAIQDAAEGALVKHYLNQFDRFEIPKPVKRPVATEPQAMEAARDLSGRPEYSGAKMAGSINLNRINTSDDVKATIETSAKVFKGAIDEQRRGVIKDEELGKLADDLGIKYEDLAKREVGEAWNAERILGARRLLVSSGENLTRIANEIRSGNNNDAKLLEFRKALEVHAEIQGQVSGLATEAGRALHQFNIQAKGNKAQMQELQHLVNQMGGRQALGDLANQVADLTGKALNAKVREAVKPSWWDKAQEGFIMSILSAPTTQEVNFLGNLVNVADKLTEGYTAAAIGLRKVHKGADQRYTFREANAQTYGLLASVPAAAKAFAKTLKTGEAASGVTFVEHRGAIGGKVGEVVRLPGRVMTAQDEGFKTLFNAMELHAQAARSGLQKGLRGEALAKHIEATIKNPPAEILNAMSTEANYRTFQQSGSKTAAALGMLKQRWPILGFVIPFVKTPINIVKYAGERTPFAVLSRQVRDDIKAGGISQDQALAKITVGGMVTAWALMQAQSGNITGGGPSDPAKRKMLLAAGWQPYSYKTPDGHYVAYNRLGPHGMLLGMAADLVDGQQAISSGEKKELIAVMVAGAMKNFGDQTFWRGISDMTKAASDPDRNLDRFVASPASAVVPNVVARTAQASDPEGVLRDTQGEGVVDSVGKAIQARIPKNDLTPDITELPVKTDPLGRPIKRENQGAAALFNPMSVSQETDDPVIKAFADAEVSIGEAPKKITIEGVELALTDEMQRAYKRIRGEAIEQLMNEEILSHSKWEGLKNNQTRRAEILDEVKREAFKAAKEEFMKRHKKDLINIYKAGKAGTP